MKLYVANCTKQVQNFQYRVSDKSVRMETIQIGTQIALSGDMTMDVIKFIIEQHERYGMVAVDEINQTRSFAGLCYSIDKPIPNGRIEALMRYNDDHLDTLGRRLRTQYQVSGHEAIQRQTQHLPPNIQLDADNYEVSVVVENPDPRDSRPPVADGVRMGSRFETDMTPKRGRGRPRKTA